MMGPLLLILWAIALIVIGYVKMKKSGSHWDGEMERGFGIAILITVIIVSSLIYIISMGEIADLDAFYSSTKETYKAIITESEAIEINLAPESIGGISAQGLAYFQLAFTVSSRIQEFGEEIAKYNNGLFRYRRYNDNWFTDGFIADVPEYLKPIVLNLSK